MQTIINDIIYAFYYIAPAYIANAVPVIFGGGYPLDAGKLFWDGKPIFGSNKTIRGLFAGLLLGTLAGFVLSSLYQLEGFPRSFLFQYNIFLGFMLSLGALTGDLDILESVNIYGLGKDNSIIDQNSIHFIPV